MWSRPGWLCAALMVSVAAPAWCSPESGANDLGLWSAFLAVGDGSTGSVLTRTDAARDSLMTTALKLQVDEQSRSLMQTVREAVLELDLGDLHDMLPEPIEGGRQVRMHGEPDYGVCYDWSLYPPQSATNGGELLALDASTWMAPVEHDAGKGDGYALRQTLDVGTGPWRHGDVAALFEQALVQLERSAERQVAPQDRARISQQHPTVDSEASLAILHDLGRAAPTTMATLGRFIRVDQIAQIRDGRLDVDFLAKLDPKAVSGIGFASLGRYIDKLGNLLVLDMSVRDGQGLPLITVGFYTAGPGLRVGFASDEGALIPRSKGGLDASRAVRPTQNAVDLRVRFDVEIRAEGMLLRISDYEIPILYRSSGGGADLAVPITGEPKLEFTGQGTITSWIAEIADSALNLESHGQVIFRAIAQGTDGEGSTARIRYDDGVGNGAVSAKVQTMVVDNALVRMGFRIVGRHLVPNDAVVGEGLDLFGTLVRNLEQDYQRVRPQLARLDDKG